MSDDSSEEWPEELEHDRTKPIGYYNHVAVNRYNDVSIYNQDPDPPNSYRYVDDPVFSRRIRTYQKSEYWYEEYPYQYLEHPARIAQVKSLLTHSVRMDAGAKYSFMLHSHIYPSPIERLSATDGFELLPYFDDLGTNAEHRRREREDASTLKFSYTERRLDKDQDSTANWSLYQKACLAYNPYPIKSGYEACFKFLMSSGHEKTPPTLILHAVPNPQWVAVYGDLKIMNPYAYRVAYQRQDREQYPERKDSVYVIRLESANHIRPYPTHMTCVPEQRYTIDAYGRLDMIYHDQTRFYPYAELSTTSYEERRFFSEAGSLEKALESIKDEGDIETQWFHEAELPEIVWASIPPYSDFFYDELHGITPAIPAPFGFWNSWKRPWLEDPTWRKYMFYRSPTDQEWRDLQRSTITHYVLKSCERSPLYPLRNQGKEYYAAEDDYSDDYPDKE